MLLLGIFFILMLGIQTSMTMQFNAVQLLLDSVKKVFQAHHGDMTGTVSASIHHSKVKDVNILSMSDDKNLFRPGAHALFEELNMAQPGLIHARLQSAPQSWRSITIARHSFIESGSGSATSDRAVQTKIGTSSSLWWDAFKHSSNTMQSVHAMTSKVEAAWKRPQISQDLLQPWASVVPEQAHLQEKIWRN